MKVLNMRDANTLQPGDPQLKPVETFTNGFVSGVVSQHVRRAFGFDEPINYGMALANGIGAGLANSAGKWAARGAANWTERKELGITRAEQRELHELRAQVIQGQFRQEDYDLSDEDDLRAYTARVYQANGGNELTAALSVPDTLSTDLPASWQRMGLQPSELVRDQLGNLTAGTSGEGTYKDKLRIDQNIRAEIAAVRRRGAEEGWDDRTMTLKLNEYIVTNYAAYGLRNPDFAWMLVGGFMAHQVRAEYLNAWDVIDQVRVGGALATLASPVAGALTYLATAAGEAKFNHTLIDAQLQVYQDVFSQAVFYEKYGATASLAMAGQLPAQYRFQYRQSIQAFASLQRADQLKAAGDFAGMRQAQIRAAGALGYREQNLLQKILWDTRVFKLWAGISDYLVRNPGAQQGPLKQMARPLSIFVGVPGATRNGFFLQPLALPNQNAAVESNRQQIAMKAFDTMRNLVSQPQPLAQVMSYFARLTHPGNLYQTYADVARVDQWRGGR
jgi:hypothetical protein